MRPHMARDRVIGPARSDAAVLATAHKKGPAEAGPDLVRI